MTKSQHYVPQFYLRKFSEYPDKKRINIYSISRNQFITAAPIKGQACKNFFYDKNGTVETGLSKFEYDISLILNKIENSFELSDDEVALLFLFASVSFLRTNKMGESSAIQMDYMLRKISKSLKIEENIKSYLDEVEFKIIHPGALNLESLQGISEIISDLTLVILKNKTSRDLITSDNPVSIHNPFLEQKLFHRGIYGVGLAGASILIPLTPKLLLCLYDSDVYDFSLPNADITNRNIIDIINTVQTFNADDIIYYNTKFSEKWISKYIFNTCSSRKTHKTTMNIAYIDKKNEYEEWYTVVKDGQAEPQNKNFVIVASGSNAKTNLLSPFLNIKKAPIYTKLGEVLVRIHCADLEEKKKNVGKE